MFLCIFNAGPRHFTDLIVKNNNTLQTTDSYCGYFRFFFYETHKHNNKTANETLVFFLFLVTIFYALIFFPSSTGMGDGLWQFSFDEKFRYES